MSIYAPYNCSLIVNTNLVAYGVFNLQIVACVMCTNPSIHVIFALYELCVTEPERTMAMSNVTRVSIEGAGFEARASMGVLSNPTTDIGSEVWDITELNFFVYFYDVLSIISTVSML